MRSTQELLLLFLVTAVYSACKDGEKQYTLSAYKECVSGQFVFQGCTQMLNSGTDVSFKLKSTLQEPGNKKFECVDSEEKIPIPSEVACTDDENNLVQPGENKTLNDGTILLCTRVSPYTIRREIFTPGMSPTSTIVANIFFKIDNSGKKVAKGCAPNNNNEIIPAGNTSVIRGIIYVCNRTNGEYTFHPVGCRSQKGDDMKVSEKRDLADGSSENCVQDGEKIIYFAATSKGCRLSNGKYVRLDSIYQEEKSLDKNGKAVKYYVNYRCTKSSNIVALTPIGCDIGQEASFAYNEMVTIGQKTYSCQLAAADSLFVESINVADASCKVGRKVYLHGQELFDTYNITIYKCDKGQLVKTGCWAKGKRFTIGETFYCADHGYFCPTAGTGPTYVGEGCTDDKGNITHYKKTYTFVDGVYTCSYKIIEVGVVPYWKPESCAYKNTFISLTAYYKDGDKYYYCDFNYENHTLVVKELPKILSECADKSIPGLINSLCLPQPTGPPSGIDEIPIGPETPKGEPQISEVGEKSVTKGLKNTLAPLIRREQSYKGRRQ